MVLAKEVRIGQYIRYNNEIYQIKRKEVVVCGTHSHSKLKFFLKPFSGAGERAINFAHTENLEIVEIFRKRGQVLAVKGNRAQIMDLVSYETIDAEIQDHVEVKEGQEATFIEMEGRFFIIDAK